MMNNINIFIFICFFLLQYLPSASLSPEAPERGLSLTTGPCSMENSVGAPKMISVKMVSVEISVNFYYKNLQTILCSMIPRYLD